MKRVCLVRQKIYSMQRNLRRSAETLFKEGYDVDVICVGEKGEKKHETIYVLSGELKITYNDEDKVYKEGEVCVIPPGAVHRMTGEKDAWYLDSSTSELDDVVRVEDDYGRV